MQIAISKGTIISLFCDGRETTFCVDNTIGFGANSIVYEVHRSDGNGYEHHYRMKECFPYNAEIIRSGVDLIWHDEVNREKIFAKFRDAYYCQLELQSDPSFGNQTAHVYDLYEGNNTLYSLMDVDFGETFDEVEKLSLEEILLTMYDLSRIVASFHEKGLLHLDLKPSNFLVSYKPVRTIRLFDMDTVTKYEDLQKKPLHSFSYSEGWCAPEQRQCIISKISPATDVYAIGAIMFQKIMGRFPSGFDTCKFSEWDFDTPLFEGVNPGIKRMLIDLFHRTISASPRLRFSDASKLSEYLNKVVSIARQKVYIQSDCPINTVDFVGRTHELKTIHESLASGQIVVLHGIGGIGKSTIALEYARRYSKEYDALIFRRYEDSLDDLLLTIDIHNYDNEDEESRRKELRRLFNKHVLLIIDNYDVALGSDPSFEELFRLKANILITSRTDFSSVYQGDLVQIECVELPFEELKDVFCWNCGLNIIDKDSVLKEVFQKTTYHTYATVLAAKQMVASGWTISDLNTQLGKGLSGLRNREIIKTQKDGHLFRGTSGDAIRVLFSLADLDDTSKQVLRNLYVLSFLRLTINDYRKIACEKPSEIDVLNDLIELGYVQQIVTHEGRFLSMHPLIQNIVREDLAPCLENCEEIAGYAGLLILNYGKYGEYNENNPLIEAEQQQSTAFLFRLFMQVGFTQEAVNTIIEWFSYLMETYEMFHPHRYDSSSKEFYERLERYVDSITLDSERYLELLSVVVLSWFGEYGIIYAPYQNKVVNYSELRKERTGYYLSKLISALSGANKEDILNNSFFQNMAEYLSDNVQFFYSPSQLPENTLKFIELFSGYFPDTKISFSHVLKCLNPPNSEDSYSVEQVTSEAEKTEKEYRHQFSKCSDKVGIVEQLIKESLLTAPVKLSIVSEMICSFIDTLSRKGQVGQHVEATKTEDLLLYGNAADRFLLFWNGLDIEVEENSDIEYDLFNLQKCSLISQALTASEAKITYQAIHELLALPGMYYFIGQVDLFWLQNNTIAFPATIAVRDLVYSSVALRRKLPLILDILVEEVDDAFCNNTVLDEERLLWYVEIFHLAQIVTQDFLIDTDDFLRYEHMIHEYKEKAGLLYPHFEIKPDDSGSAYY